MSQDLDDLVTQLKSLCIKHKQILEDLERTIAEEGQVIRRIEAERDSVTPMRTPSHAEFATAFAHAYAATPTCTAAPTYVRAPNTSHFTSGDRVYIKNEVK